MFASKKKSVAVFAEGLKIVGSVTSDGVVEVHGEVDGEMRCASIIVSRQAHVAGNMIADQVELDGRVEGPIDCGDIVLKSNANVTGDIACESVMIEKGACIEGRLIRRTGGHALPKPLSAQPAALIEAEAGHAPNGHAKALTDQARPRSRNNSA